MILLKRACVYAVFGWTWTVLLGIAGLTSLRASVTFFFVTMPMYGILALVGWWAVRTVARHAEARGRNMVISFTLIYLVFSIVTHTSSPSIAHLAFSTLRDGIGALMVAFASESVMERWKGPVKGLAN